ncbi:hypothetical protein K501DRAFT_265401 [Backusella circina FSU 941]|nr:hypothetical protein K501DRAFT_265401 [Backusella circina FSU 941]
MVLTTCNYFGVPKLQRLVSAMKFATCEVYCDKDDASIVYTLFSIERTNDDGNEDDPSGTRLFNLLPICSMSMSYIQIDKQALYKILGAIHVSYSKGDDMAELRCSTFNMSKIRFPSLEFIRCSDRYKNFTSAIRTYGVGIDFICEKHVPKKSSPPTPASIKKDIGDLSKAVIQEVDPGI